MEVTEMIFDHFTSEPDREALRQALARLVVDFDHHQGAFSNLDYFSPINLVTDQIANRCGHSVIDIQRALTSWRIHRVANVPLNDEAQRIYDDWIGAFKNFLTEVGYRATPVQIDPESTKFKNIPFLKKHVSGQLLAFGCQNLEVRRDGGFLDFSARIANPFGRPIGVRLSIVTKYGGIIRAELSFNQFHTSTERFQLSIPFELLGRIHCFDLKIDYPEDEKLVAERFGTECPNIDRMLALLRAVLSYLQDQ